MAEEGNTRSKALHVKRMDGSFQKMHVVQHDWSPIWRGKMAEGGGRAGREAEGCAYDGFYLGT